MAQSHDDPFLLWSDEFRRVRGRAPDESEIEEFAGIRDQGLRFFARLAQEREQLQTDQSDFRTLSAQGRNRLKNALEAAQKHLRVVRDSHDRQAASAGRQVIQLVNMTLQAIGVTGKRGRRPSGVGEQVGPFALRLMDDWGMRKRVAACITYRISHQAGYAVVAAGRSEQVRAVKAIEDVLGRLIKDRRCPQK